MMLRSIFSRAKRSVRQDPALHLVTIGGLMIAFASLGAALLVVTNLEHIAGVWKQSRHVTVYLQDEAKPEQVTTLRFALEALPEIKKVEHLTPDDAKAKLGDPSALGKDALALPTDFFPASFELSINRGVNEARLEQIAGKIAKLAGVQDVEIYRDWFQQLTTILNASRWGAGVLALLVAMCVLAVISHAVRLAVSERREEIEVLKLCGATDGFVSGPFIVEGAAQGIVAALLALLLLFLAYAISRPAVASYIDVVAGIAPKFLDPLIAMAIVLLGGVIGGISGRIALRRYLSV